jgi:4-carboxymuconolactone decarboxylase
VRIPLFCAISLVGIASAQDPDQALKLRGDRFPPIKYQDMTPAQKAMADRAMAGRGAIGDFNIVLRSPELADALRFGTRTANSAISAKQSELAILISARLWTTQFEWAVHHRAAVQAGLSEAIVSAIAEGRRPASLAPDEAAVYNFLRELFDTKQMSDATFAATRSGLSDQGIMDLFGVVGFYQSVSLMMNADRYPMNPGQMPELKPLPQLASASPVSASGGERFPPLAPEQMTLQQKALMDKVASGQIQGGTRGPLSVLLRSPVAAEGIVRYGEYVRFHSTVPNKLNELATLIVARHWTSQFPFSVHHKSSAQAGLSESIVTAIAEGKRPAGMQKDEEIVYNFVTGLLKTTQISDANFSAAKELLGERNLVELLGVIGYYEIVSMVLNTDRYPVPEGQQPELKPLASPLP